MFLKITINFYNGFFKKFIWYLFLYFIRFFSKNRTKMFLKISINFYIGFIKKMDTVFPYFIRLFPRNRIKILLDIGYFLV